MRAVRPTWALITGLVGVVCVAVLIAVGGTYPMIIGIGLSTIAGVLAVAEQERADRREPDWSLEGVHTLRETAHRVLGNYAQDMGGDLLDQAYEAWIDRPDGAHVHVRFAYTEVGQ